MIDAVLADNQLVAAARFSAAAVFNIVGSAPAALDPTYLLQEVGRLKPRSGGADKLGVSAMFSAAAVFNIVGSAPAALDPTYLLQHCRMTSSAVEERFRACGA